MCANIDTKDKTEAIQKYLYVVCRQTAI